MNDQSSKMLQAAQVCDRYGGISLMTLHRWMHSENGFPSPVKIGTRNFWRVSDLDNFDANLKTEKGRAPGKAA